MALKIITIETLKKSIVEAIKAGHHNTSGIIEYCEAEGYYVDFCFALEKLECERVVVYKSTTLDPQCKVKGYYLR